MYLSGKIYCATDCILKLCPVATKWDGIKQPSPIIGI